MSKRKPETTMQNDQAVVARHKANFIGYLRTQIEHLQRYEGKLATEQIQVLEAFDELLQTLVDEYMPDEGEPADGYGYNAHMGACVRALDQAASEYYKARISFGVYRSQ